MKKYKTMYNIKNKINDLPFSHTEYIAGSAYTIINVYTYVNINFIKKSQLVILQSVIFPGYI